MNTRCERYIPESIDSGDVRDSGQLDRDRVLYSPHLARLAEVTQVRNVDHGHLVHNRLTHSLKVSQLAKRIAQRLIAVQMNLAKDLGVDPDACEAAGLAHDMGHPPFGHIAEEELNSLVVQSGVADGYEGNAQTFRILTFLTIGDPHPLSRSSNFLPGLNLTRATLDGVLKYPWLFEGNPRNTHKWGAYSTEREQFDWVRKGRLDLVKSVEAEIMDWADDITYAIHDMTDFYCAGLIPLHLLEGSRGGELGRNEIDKFLTEAFQRTPKLAADKDRYREAFKRSLNLCPLERAYEGLQSQNGDLWQFSSVLINKYIEAIRLADPQQNEGRYVTVNQDAKDETAVLKQLTWHYVILHHDLATIQRGQRKVIRELFHIILEAIKYGTMNLLPRGFAEMVDLTNTEPARWAADYISGLTEREVIRVHHRMSAA